LQCVLRCVLLLQQLQQRLGQAAFAAGGGTDQANDECVDVTRL
jgi:hypothetical protein